MSQKVQDLLRQINYIEAENEIQKQILVSIPSSDTDEITETIQRISQNNKKIDELREEIKIASPEEYNKIIQIEQSALKFKEMHSESPFESIENFTGEQELSLSLKTGEVIQCLIKAKDQNGNWTVISREGELRTVDSSEVC